MVERGYINNTTATTKVLNQRASAHVIDINLSRHPHNAPPENAGKTNQTPDENGQEQF